ncbi:hypothetical protein BOX15_Mlig023816g2 [Macrostomum lignano]|uniref:Uncharacterized protein n=2 Tax=Macrostomum lignano TaxID=282301 RepID=A0A267DR18_9PLAT|nr:hypothetical protein BOX15_Mlig023816g4 [Macrostomum lignano]PAA56965.1 hypothetical protein BOX15_Mlig023816g3 [Macrostomum lignano]PAA56979.1 hypothetical protein BOX15_Mlig023816g2 [Macrostomum lignano]
MAITELPIEVNFNSNSSDSSMQKRSALLLAVAAVALCFVGESQARRTYQARIPNGNSVPDPFTPGGTWPGVGHRSKEGAGMRNPFGIDFGLNNNAWTQGLCRADSDQDGRSNGAELGDPNCVWRVGTAPPQAASGHPGVCEPVNTAHCRNINNN